MSSSGNRNEDGDGSGSSQRDLNNRGCLDGLLENHFECCICLELPYKPVILACGHIQCFWCTHECMNVVIHSKCPLCNVSYRNLPRICGVLHNLLRKLYPEEYGRRKEQVVEKEQTINRFASEVAEYLNNNDELEKLSLKDVVCSLCQKLLYNPISLNCGHLFCKSCLFLDECGSGSLICTECEAENPGGVPAVCTKLNEFLEKYFHKEHSARAIENQQSLQGLPSGSSGNNESSSVTDIQEADSHVGVGCDCCGMYPIRGLRYKCQQCDDLSGFDLCEKCYLLKSIPEGRFNQQHTADHEMVVDDSLSFIRSVGPHVHGWP